ncbi:MAG: hypothetical protein ACRCR9_01765 [Chitinophagaceae bacterium]
MLQYTVQAYNTRINITIADTTIGFDPSGLRDLGSNRSLGLINGKRKSLSSLVFTTTHGSREVRFDLKTLLLGAKLIWLFWDNLRYQSRV